MLPRSPGGLREPFREAGDAVAWGVIGNRRSGLALEPAFKSSIRARHGGLAPESRTRSRPTGRPSRTLQRRARREPEGLEARFAAGPGRREIPERRLSVTLSQAWPTGWETRLSGDVRKGMRSPRVSRRLVQRASFQRRIGSRCSPVRSPRDRLTSGNSAGARGPADTRRPDFPPDPCARPRGGRPEPRPLGTVSRGTLRLPSPARIP